VWLPRRSPVPATVLALVLLAAVDSGRAQAASVQETEPVVAVPSTEIRLVGGLGVGLEAAASLLGDRLRLDGGVHGWPKRFFGFFGDVSMLVRVLGSAANGLWLRSGFLYQRMEVFCGPIDKATALEAGLAYRKRWVGGSLFAAEAGIERVSRAKPIYCGDSSLQSSSYGLRVVAGGQYALTRGLGLYGRIGVRTGEHDIVMGFWPDLWGGVAFEF
jgi:hypothetical protein